jgi:hypothetical protein
LYYPAALAAQLVAAQQALPEEKTTQSTMVEALTKAKQALIDSAADKAKLSQAVKTTKVAYIATRDNLASKFNDLDDAMIREQEANKLREQAEAKLEDVEKRLTIVEGEKKYQVLFLKTTRQVLSKREDSSILIISTVMANAMALLKSYLSNLDVELLRKDFMVNEADREALTNGAYDVAHDFSSSYDFSSLIESEDNDSPRNM